MSNSADILMRCHVPGHEDVYALGAIDSRLTLYSQQVRAHNLAYAIREEYGSNHHVGIVGCGIGGMTLGALLALDGLHVHMFEQGPHPLHLYERAHHRWLHPRILDWPEFESLGDRAMLPVFDWVANDASAVVAVWNTELRVLKQTVTGLRINVNTSGLSFESSPLEVVWNTPAIAAQRQAVDVLILCVGYGTDRPRGPLAGSGTGSYWDPDALDTHNTPASRVLISGTGDGGLTDLFRAVLDDFAWDMYFGTIVEPHLTPSIYEGIRAAENGMRGGDTEGMIKFYDELELEGAVAALNHKVRQDTDVSLNGRNVSPFDPGASAIARLLLSQLLRVPRAVTYLQGTLDAASVDYVSSSGLWGVVVGESRHEFDVVVSRHGPHSGLDDQFPRLGQSLREARATILDLDGSDRLRKPLWSDSYNPAAKHPGLEAALERHAGAARRPERGGRYAGGPLYLEYGSEYVEVPEPACQLLTYRGVDGYLYYRRLSPVTRRFVRMRGDLPKDAIVYGR